MAQCEAEGRKHASVDLYAGIFNGNLYSSSRRRDRQQHVDNWPRSVREENAEPSLLSDFGRGRSADDRKESPFDVGFSVTGKKKPQLPFHEDRHDLRNEPHCESDASQSEIVGANMSFDDGDVGDDLSGGKYSHPGTGNQKDDAYHDVDMSYNSRPVSQENELSFVKSASDDTEQVLQKRETRKSLNGALTAPSRKPTTWNRGGEQPVQKHEHSTATDPSLPASGRYTEEAGAVGVTSYDGGSYVKPVSDLESSVHQKSEGSNGRYRSDQVNKKLAEIDGSSFGQNGLPTRKSGELNGSSFGHNGLPTRKSGELNGASPFGYNGLPARKSGELNGTLLDVSSNGNQMAGKSSVTGKVNGHKSGEQGGDIRGSFHDLTLKESLDRGTPVLKSIKVVRSGSLDSSSSHGGSSNSGSPTAAEATTKDGKSALFGNILTGKSSPSGRSMGNILIGSGNFHAGSPAAQFRSGSGLSRNSGELVSGRKSAELMYNDCSRGSASHRMGTEGDINALPGGMNRGSPETLINDHLRGSASHRMEVHGNCNRGNSLNNGANGVLHNGNLLVGGANGNVLAYGAAMKANGKQGETASHLLSPDSGLTKKLQGNLDPEDLKNTGNEYYKRGLLSEALMFYDRALMLNPDNATYRGNRAAALSGLGNFAEAVYECEEAIRLDPHYSRARQRLVSLYIRLGLLENASRHLHVAGQDVDLVELQRLQSIERHYSKCVEARGLRHWQTVIRESDAAVVAGADSAPRIFMYKCEALLRLHKPDDADSVCLVAQKIETSLIKLGIIVADPFMHTIRAQIDMALGRFEDAVTAAECAVKIDPGNAEAARLLRKAQAVCEARVNGNELFKSGRFFEALALYAEGLENDPNNAILLCNRAACRMKLGQWEKAVEDCDSALKLRPNYIKALMRRASSLSKLERWEDALQDYEILRRAVPGNMEIAREFFDVQVAIKKSRGEEIYKMKFGGDVEEISSSEEFRESVNSPGLSVVQFITRWSDRCQQLAPFIDDLCKRHPCVNFVKVDVEEHPYLAQTESVSFIPTFKLYKNGQKVREILGPTEQTLEYAVKHYSL